MDWSATTGANLYRRAKQRIPGGTQLLSKRPEMFLPDQWPAYQSRAKGCEIWDLDGRRLLDFSISGVGTCPLGYADDDVNAAVKQCLDAGNMSTLNCPVEVELADLLCRLHPWADMVRYARTGGESMAVAVRIARAATGRDKIAFCGYHGWSDWYLAANLAGTQRLDGHLLPGLEPTGVPRGLAGTMLPFRYNHIDELESIVGEHGSELAAIVMEPIRKHMPKDGFLEKARALADRVGAVLLFDEITIGWRLCLGGAHLKLGVEPDMAVFAKAISNGYPMAVIIGRGPVMQAAQTSFISSTYWTEGIGPTAALATIRKMQKVDLPAHLDRIGRLIQAGWRDLADQHGLNIRIAGTPPLSAFTFEYGALNPALVTLMTQCMLDRGILAVPAAYVTYAYDERVVGEYLAALDETFGRLKQAIDENDVEARLRGPVAHTTFARLT